jgi:hypothetical protein
MKKQIYVRKRMDSWSSIKIPHMEGEIGLDGASINSCGIFIAFPTKKAFLKQYPKEDPIIFELDPQQ